MLFLPQKTNQADYCIKTFEDEVINQKLKIIGWRDVPVNSKVVGSIASKSQPIIKQVFITKENDNQNEKEFNLKLYLARKVAENKIYSSPLSQKNFFGTIFCPKQRPHCIHEKDIHIIINFCLLTLSRES